MARARNAERSVLLATAVPESIADRVAAEAKARGMTVAQLIRIALTEATCIPVAKDSDWVTPIEQPELVEEKLIA